MRTDLNGSGFDSGALILAHEGVCCIDEFDKMKSFSHVLLESMEQQMISIVKNGIISNSPSRVVVIAAANPVSSYYDKSKTIVQNVKMSPQLLSRFDLIFPIENHGRDSDQQFLAHSSGRHNYQKGGNSFFSSQSSSSSRISVADRRKDLNWLRLEPNEKCEKLSIESLRIFIDYARAEIKPTLSPEAQQEIRSFFSELKSLSLGEEMQRITFRYLEGLIRLALARARADLEAVATRDHAIDVINLYKFSMIDVYAPSGAVGMSTSAVFPPAKKQAIVFSSMSKPKQLKAFLEHLQSTAELQEQTEYTSAELKAMGKELGIKDIEEIIFRLNNDSYILKTANGYRLT